jgi:hypothetical protein
MNSRSEQAAHGEVADDLAGLGEHRVQAMRPGLGIVPAMMRSSQARAFGAR